MCYREGFNIDENPGSTRKFLVVALVVFVLGLILSIFCSPSHAQVLDNIKIDAGKDPELVIVPREIAPLPILQAQKTTLQKQADTLAARIHDIDTAPETVVRARVTELSAAIERCPDRPVKVAGRISMNQHLRNIKADVEKNPNTYITAERDRLSTQKTIVAADLATVESDIAIREGAK